jgi:hypothetical protein
MEAVVRNRLSIRKRMNSGSSLAHCSPSLNFTLPVLCALAAVPLGIISGASSSFLAGREYRRSALRTLGGAIPLTGIDQLSVVALLVEMTHDQKVDIAPTTIGQ